jgi:hypothetical protein
VLLGALVAAVVIVELDFDELPQPASAATAKASAGTKASLPGAVLSLLIARLSSRVSKPRAVTRAGPSYWGRCERIAAPWIHEWPSQLVEQRDPSVDELSNLRADRL